MYLNCCAVCPPIHLYAKLDHCVAYLHIVLCSKLVVHSLCTKRLLSTYTYLHLTCAGYPVDKQFAYVSSNCTNTNINFKKNLVLHKCETYSGMAGKPKMLKEFLSKGALCCAVMVLPRSLCNGPWRLRKKYNRRKGSRYFSMFNMKQ